MDKKENKNAEEQISKNKFMNCIKSSTWISGTMSYIKDNDNKSFHIFLGEEMAKIDNISLILKKLKTIKTRVDGIDARLGNFEKDVSELKDDMSILKREATKHSWDLSPNK